MFSAIYGVETEQVVSVHSSHPLVPYYLPGHLPFFFFPDQMEEKSQSPAIT